VLSSESLPRTWIAEWIPETMCASRPNRIGQIKTNYRGESRKDKMMKKPVLSIEEPEPKKVMRADRPPTEGFVTVVDGHFKTEFATVDAAEAAGRKLKSAYPMLQIEIYDAANATRKLLSDEPASS
jgi:hypothetical protein